MKRISVLALALLLALCLSACAGISANPTAAPQATPEASQTPEQTPEAPQATAPSGQEAGNLAGNLNNGGFIVRDEAGVLYVALTDGVYALEAEEQPRRISNDRAVEMNYSGGRLYYVAEEYTEKEGTLQLTARSIVSLSTDGSDRQELAPSRRVGLDATYSGDYSVLQSSTDYCGYEDLMLYDGALYYIADNENAGTMTVRSSVTGQEGTVSWNADKSIYRMNLDGGSVEELVQNIGAARPHMTVDGEKIYYNTSYENCFYSYPFVTFRVCNLDGSGDQALLAEDYNPNAACSYTSDRGCFTERVDGLMAVDGTLYVTASDSEGDFPASRLMRVEADAYARVWDETYYVRTLADEEGNLIWFNAPGSLQYEADEDGVIVREYISEGTLWKGKPDSDGNTALLQLKNVDRWGNEYSSFRISVFGNDLYLLSQTALYHIDTTNGEQTALWQLPQAEQSNPNTEESENP